MPEEVRVLLSTFALLFVAELGDKTQLAVISMTAKHKAPLWIFIGAATALIAVTALGVLGGELLTRRVRFDGRHLTLNVDYYYIDITDEVDQLTYQQKLDEEFALRRAGATGDAVGDVTRRAGGRLDTITSLQTNIGTKKTEGLDAEISYGFSMGRFGDMNTTLYWTHVLEYEESDVEDPTRTLHLDGTVFYPKNRGQLTVGWNMGDYSATIVGVVTGDQVLVHYDGHETAWDETIHIDRIVSRR